MGVICKLCLDIKAVCALSLTDNCYNKIDSSVLLGLQIGLVRAKTPLTLLCACISVSLF